MKVRISVLLTCAITLGACETIGGPGASSYYDCGLGTRLKVDYLGGGVAQVQVNGNKPVVLAPQKSASGAMFSNGQYTFWSKGSDANWTAGRMAPMQCREVAVPR